MLKLKRIYDAPSDEDGFRVLVDRLWPRGLSKEEVRVNLWLKEVAPSDALRKWFGHEPEKWPEFERRYHAELAQHEEALEALRQRLRRRQTVTLLYAAKDETRNNAVALASYLRAHPRRN
ncbi:MAG: DUF488 family protein [Burkholderiales bacterium]|jgi:Uncharacterized conserved protein|nr:DUF488 family protein [Burkholderiales bacterium]PZN02350.1 MAG: hypothetical protein DIU74_08050 [Pseudomonadota bacterium]